MMNYSTKNTQNTKKTQKPYDNKDWTSKKNRSILLAESYQRLGYYKKSIRTKECGNYLEYIKNPKTKDTKIHKAMLCRDRFCPVCSWRKTIKQTTELNSMIDFMDTDNNRYLFMTLTGGKRVFGDTEAEAIQAIKDRIDLLNKAFAKLMKRKQIKNSILGYYRSLEMPVDKEQYITSKIYNKLDNKKGLKIGDINPNYLSYHPHFHIIWSVKEEYFSKNNDLYITDKQWGNLWAECLNIGFTPIIDIRAIKTDKNNKNNDDLRGGIKEVTKYAVKDTDYIIKSDPALTDKLVCILNEALKGKRTISLGGNFKKANKEIKLLIQEDENIKNNREIENGYTIEGRIDWNWNDKRYYFTSKNNRIYKKLDKKDNKTLIHKKT